MQSINLRRPAFSLLEMVLVVVVISAVTLYSLQLLDKSQAGTGQRDCDVVRQILQNRADRYFEETGLWPDRHLLQIARGSENSDLVDEGGGANCLLCPAHGGNYRMSGAIVICPTHEPTRRN